MLTSLTSSNTWSNVVWNAPGAPVINKVLYDGVTVWERLGPQLLRDFTYTMSGSNVNITGWRGTYQGVVNNLVNTIHVPYIGSGYNLNLDGLNFVSYSNRRNLYVSIDNRVTINNNFHNRFYAMSNMNSCNIPYDQLVNMSNMHVSCYNLTADPYCGPNVTNMYQAYSHCWGMTGQPVCGESVINFANAYNGCQNITGQPVCSNTVINMNGAYAGCRNMNGYPVCGENVTGFGFAYARAINLTGSPVCGENVSDMYYTYFGCNKLTGAPAVGNNVLNMSYAYSNCTNLTLSGKALCGNSARDLSSAYRNIPQVYGNIYFPSPSITNFINCFNGRNTPNTLNIYVPVGSTTFRTLQSGSSFIFGWMTTYWNANGANKWSTNSQFNAHLYAVPDVWAAKSANGD